jgi:hypothetical protein
VAINQNHTFEDLNGIKCGIVEKNVLAERAGFLKNLLEYNQFTVVVVPSPPPKITTPPPIAPVSDLPPDIQPQPTPAPDLPETFTVGVTDVTFNSINAIFGRLLHTQDGHVVTLAYWQQKEEISKDEIPYFNNV